VHRNLWSFVVKERSLLVHLSWKEKLHLSMVINLYILWNMIYDTFRIGISLFKVSVQLSFMSNKT